MSPLRTYRISFEQQINAAIYELRHSRSARAKQAHGTTYAHVDCQRLEDWFLGQHLEWSAKHLLCAVHEGLLVRFKWGVVVRVAGLLPQAMRFAREQDGSTFMIRHRTVRR